MYTWIDLEEEGGFEQLRQQLTRKYAPKEVINALSGKLTPQCRYVLLEYPYVDKDYRSTYYHFYAKKGRRYSPDCVRLHFFRSDVELTDDRQLRISGGQGATHHSSAEEQKQLSDRYYGYMVIRPTFTSTIGRTVLSPNLISGFHGWAIESRHTAHLLGHRLSFDGFPWMYQHTDINVCAHVACWSILRHYSERFSKYSEYLTYEITRMAHQFDPGGLVPSRGLANADAERIFHEAGTYPIVEYKPCELFEPPPPDEIELFYRQLAAYVESGFPVYARLPEHAVVVVGRDHYRPGEAPKVRLQYSWDITDALVVIDDNRMPYTLVSRSCGPDEPYGSDEFGSFIVALPEKFFYSAKAIDKFASTWVDTPTRGFDYTGADGVVIRYFATTTAAYRRFVHEKRSQFASEIIQLSMDLPMPQFIWIIEISTREEWAKSHVGTRIIIDATANEDEKDPMFMMYDKVHIWYRDRAGSGKSQRIKFAAPLGFPLSRMEDNLVSHGVSA